MHLRRHEEEVGSLEQLRKEITRHGGAVRGFFYEDLGFEPEDMASDFCREDTEVRDVIGIPGIFHEPEDFKGHEKDIIFVPDDMRHIGARLVTPEIVTSYGVSVLTRHRLGEVSMADVHHP